MSVPDIAYAGEQYLAADYDPQALEESHTTLNARISLLNGDTDWELAVIGKNLTDEEIRTFSGDPLLLNGAYFAYLKPPRTLEIQFRLSY